MPELTEGEYRNFKAMEAAFLGNLAADVQRKRDAVMTSIGQYEDVREHDPEPLPVLKVESEPTEPAKG